MLNFKILLLLLILIPFSSGAVNIIDTTTSPVNQGILQGVSILDIREIFNNNTAFVNQSQNWNTISLGPMDDANATQFDNLANVLNIDESWVNSLWCQLTGCTMTGDIDMSNNNLLNVDNITIDNNIFFGDADHFLRKGTLNFNGLGTNAFSFHQNVEHPEGTIPFIVSVNKTNSDNDAVLIMVQSGLNESNSVLGNSWVIAVNNLTNNLTEFSKCFLVAGLLNETLRVQCDSGVTGADLIVQDDIQSFGTMFADGGIRAETLVDFVMNGEDVNIQGGGLHIFTPVTFEQGVVEGNEVTVFMESFGGGLGSFTNLQTDLGNWFVTSNILCDDGDCANAIGISGVGNIIIEANISTLNINSTSLNFIYSLSNMLGANDFEVTVNNNVGSGEVSIFTDATNDVVKSSQSIALPSSMSNQSSVSIRFNCDVTNTNRQCFVDTISVNGTAIATTLTNVSGFNSVWKMSDGALAADGFPERGIFYVAENDTIVIRGNATFENIIEQDLNVTNSITLNSVTIFDWGSIPDFLLTNGTSVMQGIANWGGFGIINVLSLISSSGLWNITDGGEGQFQNLTTTDLWINGSQAISSINLTTKLSYFAERGVVVSSNYWAWGNGQDPQGGVVLFDGKLTKFGVQCDEIITSTSLTMEVHKNGVDTGCGVTVGTNEDTAYTNLTCNTDYVVGDILGFFANTEIGDYQDCVATAVIEIPFGQVSGLKGDKGDTGFTPWTNTSTDATLDNNMNGIVDGNFTLNGNHVSGQGLHLFGDGFSAISSRGGAVYWYQSQTETFNGVTYINDEERFVFDTASQSTPADRGNAWIDFNNGDADFGIVTSIDGAYRFGTGSSVDQFGMFAVSDDITYRVDLRGEHIFYEDGTQERVTIGEIGLEVKNKIITGSNSFSGLSDGDINVSTVYYDTLTAKSPIVFELGGGVILTRVKGSDWVECNPSVKGDCPLESENKMLNIYSTREDEFDCKSNNYSWDGECFEVVKILTDYNGATENYQKPIMEKYSCNKLDHELKEVFSTCERESGQTQTSYRRKEGCDWNVDDRYYCEVRELRSP